jgi:hypothetical protein
MFHRGLASVVFGVPPGSFAIARAFRAIIA